jgi:environmental stress-induced protein Ves
MIFLSPADYVDFPWKNGRGTTTDIAAAYRPDAKTRDWTEMLWRFGRTPIFEDGPYSDLSGFEWLQVLVAGKGFTIHTADGAVHRDLTRPLVPVRYDGGTKLGGRLIDGPVETVNFLYRRDSFDGDLRAPAPGTALDAPPGTHLIYAPAGADTLYGGAGDDTLIGGAGDDILRGEAGSDVAYFGVGSGRDDFDGGAGGGWTDTVIIQNAGMGPGQGGWTVVLDNGTELTSTLASGTLELGQDVSGTIVMADGSEMTFDNLERITW